MSWNENKLSLGNLLIKFKREQIKALIFSLGVRKIIKNQKFEKIRLILFTVLSSDNNSIFYQSIFLDSYHSDRFFSSINRCDSKIGFQAT